MPIADYPDHELKPRKLTEEEIKNPYQVIDEFFSFGHIPQIRDLLWEFLKTTVTGNYPKKLSRRERCDLIHFYEKIEKLIEAAHLIHKEKVVNLAHG